jgi:hypothetical protein
MASEYKVIILDPAPTEATETLNALAAQGWTVAGVYADDRVILFRFTETFTMASGGLPAGSFTQIKPSDIDGTISGRWKIGG